MQLTDKVALVTGRSRGIGAATAKRLAKDGANIAITYATDDIAAKNVVVEIESEGGTAIALRADVRILQDVIDAVDATFKQFGRLDILVNNAGVGSAGPLADVPADEVDRVFDTHVKGAYLMSQSATNKMSDGGRIIISTG